MKQPYNTALYMRLSRDDENYGDSVSIETQRTIFAAVRKGTWPFGVWRICRLTDGAERTSSVPVFSG